MTTYTPFSMSGAVILSNGDPTVDGSGTFNGSPVSALHDESDTTYATLLRGVGGWPIDMFFTQRTEAVRQDIDGGDGMNAAARIRCRVGAGTPSSAIVQIGIGSEDLSTYFYVNRNVPIDGTYLSDAWNPTWFTLLDPDGWGDPGPFIASGNARLFVFGYGDASHYDLEVAEASIGLITTPAPPVTLPCNTPVGLDLSGAAFLVNPGNTHPGPYGYYDPVDDEIHPSPNALGPGVPGFPDFVFGITLDPVTSYEVTIVNDGNSDADGNIPFFLYTAPVDSTTTPDNWVELYNGDSNTLTMTTFTIGPGVDQWDDVDFGVAARPTTIWFETDNLAAILSITIKKLCAIGGQPPRRQYPRNDGLAASSAKRLYPPPPTVQASNRRGPSAII